MLKSDELKQDITAKRKEIENYQREQKIAEAKNAATELNNLVDELDVELAKERAEDEKFFSHMTPAFNATPSDEKSLRRRAFNKLVFNRGKLTEAECRAYNVVGQIEGTDEKGGYLVPEEQITTLREYRKAYTQLKEYCHVVQANSTSGKYPTLGEESGVLVNFTELEDLNVSDFEFGQAKYEIQDYGDIIPISNLLIRDADLDIISIVGQRLARKAVNTENALILSKLNTLPKTAITDHKGLNKALIKDIDPVYWSNAKIYTNQDGFLWLSSLVDANQRPLLQPDVAAPDVYRYKGKEVIVTPNSTMPNDENKIPFYVGNMADYLMFFEREGVEIAVSTEALFKQYGTAIRCVVRFGATIDDQDAMIALTVATN